MTETLKTMEPGFRYIVTKGSECGTFQTGDGVTKCPNYFDHKTEDIMCQPIEGGGGGWLEESEWSEFTDLIVKIDAEYYKEKTARLKAALAILEGINANKA